jgi:hypothetical protein
MKMTSRQWRWLLVVTVLTAICYAPPVFGLLIGMLPQPWGFFAFACAHSLILVVLFALAPNIPEPGQGGEL